MLTGISIRGVSYKSAISILPVECKVLQYTFSHSLSVLSLSLSLPFFSSSIHFSLSLSLYHNSDLANSVGKDKQPVLFAYIERMKQLNAIKQTMLPVENHLKFYKSIKDGDHDYSAGIAGVKIYASKPE